MNLALFGGTFDPIHRGHLKVARAAAAHFGLKQVWFVPADIPPHKQKEPITLYEHRFAMTALAVAGEKEFIPSLLEAPEQNVSTKERRPSYSIETVRRVKKKLGKSDHLYFLIGMDAFKDIAKWYEAEAMLKECDFIVAARPGFSLADVASSLPRRAAAQCRGDKAVSQRENRRPTGASRSNPPPPPRNTRECFSHAHSRGRRSRRRAKEVGARRGCRVHS